MPIFYSDQAQAASQAKHGFSCLLLKFHVLTQAWAFAKVSLHRLSLASSQSDSCPLLPIPALMMLTTLNLVCIMVYTCTCHGQPFPRAAEFLGYHNACLCSK